MPDRYRADSSHVVHETIDGETILIDLRTGTYYSLDEVGSELWQAIAGSAPLERVMTEARRRYEGEPAEIELGVSGFVERLEGEGLLVAADEATPDAADVVGLPAGRTPFSVPALHVYTDMQEFLLLDPIHQVDEVAGWPNASRA